MAVKISDLTEATTIRNDDLLVLSLKELSGVTSNWLSRKVSIENLKDSLQYKFVHITLAEYDSLSEKDNDTLYCISDDSDIDVNNGKVTVSLPSFYETTGIELATIYVGAKQYKIYMPRDFKADGDFASNWLYGNGVVNGEILKSTTPSNYNILTNDTNVKIDNDISYVVEHDSLLVIKETDVSETQSYILRILVYVNYGGTLLYIGDIDRCGSYNNKSQIASFNIPVKKGTEIVLRASGVTDLSLTASLTFTEFKLVSLSPLIPMPDYSRAEALDVGTPDTQHEAIDSGYIFAKTDNSKVLSIKNTNNNSYINFSNSGMSCVPVSYGTIWKYSSTENTDKPIFVPCKNLYRDPLDVIGIMYPVGSIYFTLSDVTLCPLASLIPGSTWDGSNEYYLINKSVHSVVGNGKPITLNDGNYNLAVTSGDNGVLLRKYNQIPTTAGLISQGSYTDSFNTPSVNNELVLGVSTNKDKSGLSVDLSDNSLLLKMWKRIK